MILCPLTCGNVAYICQRCRHLPTSCTLWLTRQGRSVARCAPVPATLPGDLDRGTWAKDCAPGVRAQSRESTDERWHEQSRPVLRAAGAQGTARGRVDAHGVRAADRL